MSNDRGLMLRKLLTLFGIGVACANGASAAEPFAPYSLEATNQIYNLLFCDDPRGFAPRPGEAPTPWQVVLFGNKVDWQSVETLANDSTAEGRVRALAYNWLRRNGHAVRDRRSTARRRPGRLGSV